MRENTNKYFLYARKSSESEDRQMASIDDQISEVKKLAQRLDLNIVDIIYESKTAKEPGRIGFNDMLRRIHKGEARGIITWKLNRLARNPVDGGQISWMLQQNMIHHIQTIERDYRPKDNVLMMQLEFGMANQFVKDLSVDVKRGMKQKAERGWCPINVLSIGYQHNHRYKLGKEPEIIINDDFKIIKGLWKELLTGKYSIADIKRKGDKQGLRNRQDRPYSLNTYHKIFKNEFYTGCFYWKDEQGGRIKHQGKHKRMISDVEFQKAQIILGNRSNQKKKQSLYDYPYRSLITCNECGSILSPDHKLQVICTGCRHKSSMKTLKACPRCNLEFSKMKNPSIIDILYYSCTKRKPRCYQKSIRKEQIESFFENYLEEQSVRPEMYKWAHEQLKTAYDKSSKKDEVRNLKKRKTELKNRLDQIMNMRIRQEISKEQFISKNIETQEEINKLILEIDLKEKKSIKKNQDLIRYNTLMQTALEKFKSGDNSIKDELMRTISPNLELKDKTLLITTRKDFQALMNLYSAYTSN